MLIIEILRRIAPQNDICIFDCRAGALLLPKLSKEFVCTKQQLCHTEQSEVSQPPPQFRFAQQLPTGAPNYIFTLKSCPFGEVSRSDERGEFCVVQFAPQIRQEQSHFPT